MVLLICIKTLSFNWQKKKFRVTDEEKVERTHEFEFE